MKMIKTVLAATVIGLALSAPSVYADKALATANGCLACHGIDNKIVGPAFKEIAAKYKGDAGAPATLEAKVKAGGTGNWGQIPMPPNAHVSDDKIKAIVAWVLTL